MRGGLGRAKAFAWDGVCALLVHRDFSDLWHSLFAIEIVDDAVSENRRPINGLKPELVTFRDRRESQRTINIHEAFTDYPPSQVQMTKVG